MYGFIFDTIILRSKINIYVIVIKSVFLNKIINEE